jgi:hypothetical protein
MKPIKFHCFLHFNLKKQNSGKRKIKTSNALGDIIRGGSMGRRKPTNKGQI